MFLMRGPSPLSSGKRGTDLGHAGFAPNPDVNAMHIVSRCGTQWNTAAPCPSGGIGVIIMDALMLP